MKETLTFRCNTAMHMIHLNKSFSLSSERGKRKADSVPAKQRPHLPSRSAGLTCPCFNSVALTTPISSNEPAIYFKATLLKRTTSAVFNLSSCNWGLTPLLMLVIKMLAFFFPNLVCVSEEGCRRSRQPLPVTSSCRSHIVLGRRFL